MPKVTFLKSRFSFQGGLEKYTKHLINAFLARDCEVTLLTTGDVENPIPGVETISLTINRKFSLAHLLRFDSLCQKWLSEHPQEIVFGMERNRNQTHYRAGSGVHSAYLKRRRLSDSFLKTLTFSLNPLHRSLLNNEKKAFENPELKILFTNSQMVKDEILENYQTDPKKIVTVHNGVEWNEWEEPFKMTPKKEGGFHFLFVGNGYQRKGVKFLLEGFAKLARRDCTLTLVGKEKNMAFFQSLASRLGILPQVNFAGPQKELIPFYQMADALVISSIYDPFSNVTLEALALGLFVVSSPFNGGHEVLLPSTGVVIDELTDRDSFADSLKIALDHPKTSQSALHIRESIKELDFSHQLDKIVQKSLQAI